MVECGIPGHITGLYIFAVFNLCALLNISFVSADVFVINTADNFTIASMDDKQAMFGPDFPKNGLTGRVVYITPHNACMKVDPPPPGYDLPWIALISRGPCHFDLKVLNVQKANYSAAIIHNYKNHESIMPMAGDSGRYSDQIRIPSVFVGYTDGMQLAYRYNYTKKSVLVRIEEFPFDNFTSYFWPFTVVVSVCFLILLVFSIFKCIKYIQHRQRTRLSKRALKKIPIRKYKKGDHYDTCAICLDDYEEGEKLRVLPCNHTYHSKCIDPWLTKRKKTCPQCKRRVIPGQETDTDSETEGEGEAASENSRLLGSNPVMTHGPSYGSRARNSAGTGRRGQRGQDNVAVVVEDEASTSQAQPLAGGDSSDSEDEELEGAVGGVAVPSKKTEKKADLVVEVEAPEAGDSAAQAGPSRVVAADAEAGSPARVEGSINVAFSSSGSSEDDATQGNAGSSAGTSRGRGKKKKNKTNHVV